MERNEVALRVKNAFMQVMDLENVDFCDSTTADDVEDWDSLSQIQLVSALQNEFGIKLTSREIRGMDNVGELIDLILNKCNN